MEAKHTALPWYSTPSGDIFSESQLQAIATVHQNGANMASLNEKIATAEFIARACNGYDDLQRRVDVLESALFQIMEAAEQSYFKAISLLKLREIVNPTIDKVKP